MIEELSITIKKGGLRHVICIDTDMDSNLPYDIACAIEEVVHLTSANPEIVIEQLIGEYGLPDSCKEKKTGNDGSANWHDHSVTPNIGEAVYVEFEDERNHPFVILNICTKKEWQDYVDYHKVKRWCYLNEVLKDSYKI